MPGCQDTYSARFGLPSLALAWFDEPPQRSAPVLGPDLCDHGGHSSVREEDLYPGAGAGATIWPHLYHEFITHFLDDCIYPARFLGFRQRRRSGPRRYTNYRLGGPMTRETLRTANGTPSPDRANPTTAPGGPHDSRDPWLRPGSPGFRTSPQAGQAGHGRTAVLRSQPVLVVDGRVEGGAFELICCECGDNPFLDYSQVASPAADTRSIPDRRGPGRLRAASRIDHL
jgi:hypothetical protein